MIKNQQTMRVFFALWPEEPVRQALHALALAYQAPCGGRAMDAENLHLTLLFLGNLNRTCLPQLMACAGKVAVPAFEFALERVALWRHIACMLPEIEVPALHRLHGALQDALEAAGIACESREFSPHVTLLRHVEQALVPQRIKPVRWRANAFVLVESVTTDQGVRYRILQQWSLGSQAG